MKTNRLRHLFAALIMGAAICSCSSTPGSPSSAAGRGKDDAEALIAANLKTEKELNSALLAVKAREWELREQSGADIADAYISGFKEYLLEHNRPLAEKIFTSL